MAESQHRIVSLNSSTATRLTPNGGHGGMTLTIQNSSASDIVYIGGTAEVTSSNYGFKLVAGAAIAIDLPSSYPLWAIGSTTVNVSILQIGLEVR
jgi:hypothetical protein